MALGALSLPSVETAFTSGSTAMVPTVSSVSTFKRMSPVESIQEVFYEIRDNLINLGKIFAEKISGLNSHLAFRLEKVSATLENIGHNIGVMAYNQEKLFGIEKEKYSEFQEDEREDERDESLGKGEKGYTSSGMDLLDTLKERFNGLIDLLSPKSELGKIGLVGALTLGVMALLPKLEKSLEGVFRFTGEKLIPFLDSIFDIKDDETGEFKWDRILGVSLGAYLVTKSFPFLAAFITKKAFAVPGLVPGVTKVLGIVGLATWATSSIFQGIGDWAAAKDWTKELGATDNETLNKISGALAGDLKGGIMNAFLNAGKFAGIGATVGFVAGGPVGALIGGAIGGVVGGLLGWLGGGQLAQSVESLVEGVKGIYNNVTQGIRNFFYDYEVAVEGGPPGMTRTERSAVGKVMDRFKADFKLMGEDLADFFYDEDGNLFGINFSFLKDILPSIREIADTIVSSLPSWMRPDTLNEKLAEVESDLAEEMAKPTEGGFFTDTQDPSRIKRLTRKKEKIEEEIKLKFPDIDVELLSGNSKIVNDGGVMKDKITVFKSTIDSKEQEDSGSQSMVIAPVSSTNNSGNIYSSTSQIVGLDVNGKNAAVDALENLSKVG